MTEPPSTRRGPYPKGVERRRKIVEAAVTVFAQYGYAGGSLRRIASQVGLTNASLIRYFGSKESLLTAVLAQWSKEGAAVMRDASGMDYFAALISLMEYHVTHRNFNELFLTLAVEASNPDHPAHTFFVERYSSKISECVANLDQARTDGEFNIPDSMMEDEARGLIAIMDGIELQWLLNPNFDLVESFRYQLNAALMRWRSGTSQRLEPEEVNRFF